MATGNWMTVTFGDEVAILPHSASPDSDVLDIQSVKDIGPMFIHLYDGQMFLRIGGSSVQNNTCIVPATEQHRAALKAKGT